jgi:hypothetical protein
MRDDFKYFLLAVAFVLLLSLPVAAAPKKKPKMPTEAQKRMSVPAGKPEIFELEPRGIQRGTTVEIKLIGTNLAELTALLLPKMGFTGEFIRTNERTATYAWIKLTAAANLPRAAYDISVKNTNSESSKLKLYVDDLPQYYESKTNKSQVLKLPASFWGTLEPAGNTDDVLFEAQAGQTVVFDLHARDLGSKANAALSLFDDSGVLLASNNGFDGGDPLLVFKMPASGRYRIHVNDNMAAGSHEHYYRLSLGEFPEVVGCYPLSVAANSKADVELIGYNLPPGSNAHVKTGKDGEAEVPVDTEKFRSRRSLKVVADILPAVQEVEPNDTPAQAMKISAPCVVNGRIWNPAGGTDTDLFRFRTEKGRRWIIETDAARHGSPVDTKIEVLHPDGAPVTRLLLQAVRNSAINFKAIDSVIAAARLDNWREMELNNYYYMQGDVARLLRMPQGPDSDLLFFMSNGKRTAFFDTTATGHALDEPGYIVEPHEPGEKLESNGLPVFPVYYENDDDGERGIGADSRVHFTAPEDGDYLIRVTDTRGHGGERFAYRLIVREGIPDFNVSLGGANPTVEAGSGKEFAVNANRIDGFNEDVRVDITNVPAGFTVSTPLVIQSGQTEAKGTLHALSGAMQPNETNLPAIKVTAAAMVDGKSVTKDVNDFGKIKLGEKPKLFVFLEPKAGPIMTDTNSTSSPKPFELTVTPGGSVSAWLKVRRNGHEELITFSVENLPFGVIVDNIGLNGVLIPKGENERQIFFTCEKWVPDTDRLCYAVEGQTGRQTSLPLLLHVRKNAGVTTAQAR